MNNTATARVEAYLENQSQLDLLRFITCGSVDDGKSTLIGRLLYEAQTLSEDQITALKSDSIKQGTQGEAIDFALLVDGLAAEREQGITIDVAYRFFATTQRKFIVADTPGHEQYTRNMATAASTGQLAVILIDARKGVLTQSKRHSFIAALLGIRHLVLAINKMDLVNYAQSVYQEICEDYQQFAQPLSFTSITPIPLSALCGDNIITRSSQTTWYHGPTLLGFLETVTVDEDKATKSLRFPVQWVNRPDSHFRGFSGTIMAGTAEIGETVRILPSGESAKIRDILLYQDHLQQASADQAVTITLDREIDISRGDVFVSAQQPCEIADQFEATVVWMDRTPGYVGRSYGFRLGTIFVNATITEIRFRYNVDTLEEIAVRELQLNAVGVIRLSLDRNIPFDPYREIPMMGAFILIDRFTNATTGAGMIVHAMRRSSNIHQQALAINQTAREQLNGHRARCVWFTGLSGAGKSTLANALEKALYQRGIRTYLLDGDNIRHGLNRDLGFTDADRIENIRRVAEVARLMVDAGTVVITAFISPFRAERQSARKLFNKNEFIEIFVNVPLETAIQRDPKGLYQKAQQGKIPNFTGIGSAYEPPDAAELTLSTANTTVENNIKKILQYLDNLPEG